MIDMNKTVVPKSDQLNADDLVGGPKLLIITNVTESSTPEQPIHIHYEGGEGRPWKPCLTMRRLLIHCWGDDGEKYIGRQVLVYSDPKVRWAGSEIGGIRFANASHIKAKTSILLSVSRGKRQTFTVEPIITEPLNELTEEVFAEFELLIVEAENVDQLQEVGAKIAAGKFDKAGAAKLKAAYREANKALRNN